MIGLTSNYLIYEVNEKLLDKPGILDAFKRVDYDIEDFDIKKLILDVLAKDGVVYGVKESKCLRAVFIFKGVIKKNKGKKAKELVFLNAYFTEDLSNAVPGFVGVIEDNLREKIASKEITKVKWNNKEITYKPYVFLREALSSFFACVALGLCLGVVLNKLLLCLFLGAIVGFFLGAIVRITK